MKEENRAILIKQKILMTNQYFFVLLLTGQTRRERFHFMVRFR